MAHGSSVLVFPLALSTPRNSFGLELQGVDDWPNSTESSKILCPVCVAAVEEL